jgi:nitroreductase/NAD-dependent dihydropyrimidine dehydrogenase PreA subunit
MISFDYNKCIYCLNCSKVCPIKAIGVKDNKPAFIREGNCISCGHCISVCPVEAVSGDFNDSLPGKKIKNLNIPSSQHIEDFILSRRSIRAYDNREVEKDVLDKILRIAAHAPTGSNSQNVKYFVVGKKGTEHLEQLGREYFLQQPKEWIGEIMLNEGYRVLLGAPVTIGLYSKKGQGLYNCAIAGQNLVLAAYSLGLGTCYNGIFTGAYHKSKAIQEYFDLPEDHEMHMFISLGYPDPKVRYKHAMERKSADVIWKD